MITFDTVAQLGEQGAVDSKAAGSSPVRVSPLRLQVAMGCPGSGFHRGARPDAGGNPARLAAVSGLCGESSLFGVSKSPLQDLANTAPRAAHGMTVKTRRLAAVSGHLFICHQRPHFKVKWSNA